MISGKPRSKPIRKRMVFRNQAGATFEEAARPLRAAARLQLSIPSSATWRSNVVAALAQSAVREVSLPRRIDLYRQELGRKYGGRSRYYLWIACGIARLKRRCGSCLQAISCR
jgi:hypothetical protein